MFEDHHQREVTPHRQVCLRLCHQKGAEQSHSRSQSEHHVSGFAVFLSTSNSCTCNYKVALEHPANLGRKCILLEIWLILSLDYRKLADGLFLQSCAEVAQLYPKIKYENIIIDNCCMQVIETWSSQMYQVVFLMRESKHKTSCVIPVLICCSWSRIPTSLMFW